MKRVEVIDKSNLKPCNKCKGKGGKQCVNGYYVDENYFIIVKDSKGNQIAFQSDCGGK